MYSLRCMAGEVVNSGVSIWWSITLTAVGLFGFWLAGRKVWWAWYINIACQFIWLPYAIVSKQWPFIVASIFYFVVFSRNAIKWTREHRVMMKPNRVYPGPPPGIYRDNGWPAEDPYARRED